MFDLKKSDLPELERLAKSGYGWIARDWNEQVYAYTAKPFKNTTTWVGGAKCEKIIGLGINSQIGVRWSDPEPLNIAAAIAQIKAQSHAKAHGTPLTWNDRINQMTVGETVDVIFSHNEIVALWEERKDEEGKAHYQLWKGMGWAIPDSYKMLRFKRIFGVIPENILESDTVNILVSAEATDD